VPCDGVNSSVSDSQQLTDMTSDLPAAGDHKPAVVLPLNHTSAEPLIVHAGAVVSMLHLLPSIACQQQPQVINMFDYTADVWCCCVKYATVSSFLHCCRYCYVL